MFLQLDWELKVLTTKEDCNISADSQSVAHQTG